MNTVRNKILVGMLLLIIILFFLTPSIMADEKNREVVVLIKTPSVDTEEMNGVIISTGIGKPPQHIRKPAQRRLLAERAAKVMAYRNLMQAARRMEPVMVESGTISVDGFLKGARIVQKRYMSNGSVEVDMKLNVNLKGGVRQNDNTVEVIEHKIASYGYPVGVVSEETHEVTRDEVE